MNNSALDPAPASAAPRAPAVIEEVQPSLDFPDVREDFPILRRLVHGRRLVYLDNAATTQKPRAVIQALSGYYENYNANVHRGIHTLAEEATAAYESTRRKVAQFIGSPDWRQVIFTRNTTEGINLLASTLGEARVGEGDEILLTQMEHHSNLVPWILLARRKGARVRHIPVTPGGRLDLEAFEAMLNERTRIVSLMHISNVLGTVNPVAEIAARARAAGAAVIVDAAQSAPHLPLNVEALGADFVCFSSHKMVGPTGVGVLWGRREALEALPPYMGGGEMIQNVDWEAATWNELPWKFEAGTPNIADVVAFGSAIDYLANLGMSRVHAYVARLTDYAIERLAELKGIRIFGPPPGEERGAVSAFALPDLHPHDLSSILDHQGIAIRAGHHCAQPLHRLLGVSASARASFYFYNDKTDVNALIEAIQESRRLFGFSR